MGKSDRCCVGGCTNDKRYGDKIVARSHVEHLQFHAVPRDPEKQKIWERNIRRGRDPFHLGKYMLVCSNHFPDGKPTTAIPHPLLFMRPWESSKKSPQVRPKVQRRPSQETKPAKSVKGRDANICVGPGLQFEQLTREADVHFYTGFTGTLLFLHVFNFLRAKASAMQYWKGEKQTMGETASEALLEKAGEYKRPGPRRKLSLEQEFLLVMMRLRLGLLEHDLGFRFSISQSLVSSIFGTWIKLMRRELGWLIIWPSRLDVRKSLPACFRKWFPKVRAIIDCTEMFIETPSSLDNQAACWSEYKHHCTFKILVSITPTGQISFVSNCYGGRASDQFVVNDSGFYGLLEPFDQLLADRGFKIRDDLLAIQCSIAIPPSTQGSLQMVADDVKLTSRVANVRIYVEQAIGRLKWYRILRNEMSISCLGLVDDIVVTCCALCNLLDPLCVT